MIRAPGYLPLLYALAVMMLAACVGDVAGPQSGSVQPVLMSEGVVQIDAGGDHTCALRNDGEIVCWGEYGSSRVDQIPPGTYTQVSAGGHPGNLASRGSCAIRTDGAIACWPNQPAPPSATFTQVSIGTTHACALWPDGAIACWGSNDMGESTPPPGRFTQVSAGDYFTCALRPDGTVFCWGRSGPNLTNALAGRFTQVSAGHTHACALGVDQRIVCSTPSRAPEGTFVQVSAGGGIERFITCGVKTDGTIACVSSRVPALVPPSGSFSQVTVGGNHMCALRLDGGVVCWGGDDFRNPGVNDGGPRALTGFSARRISASSVQIDWTDTNPEVPDDYKSSLELQRRVWYAGKGIWTDWRNSKYLHIHTVQTFDETTSDTHTYQYRIRACTLVGCSAYTPAATVQGAALPAPPSNLIASATSSLQVDLTWTDGSSDETSFVIERRVAYAAEGVWTVWHHIASTPPDATQFSDHTVSGGYVYEYRVSACNNGGCSTAALANAPATPSSLGAPSGTLLTRVQSAASQNMLETRLSSSRVLLMFRPANASRTGCAQCTYAQSFALPRFAC